MPAATESPFPKGAPMTTRSSPSSSPSSAASGVTGSSPAHLEDRDVGLRHAPARLHDGDERCAAAARQHAHLDRRLPRAHRLDHVRVREDVGAPAVPREGDARGAAHHLAAPRRSGAGPRSGRPSARWRRADFPARAGEAPRSGAAERTRPAASAAPPRLATSRELGTWVERWSPGALFPGACPAGRSAHAGPPARTASGRAGAGLHGNGPP